MQRFLFSVLDSKSGVFSAPFTSINQSVAIRDFHRAVNDPQTDIYSYPEDYGLYEMAEFDDNTGIIKPHPLPVPLGLGITFRKGELPCSE